MGQVEILSNNQEVLVEEAILNYYISRPELFRMFNFKSFLYSLDQFEKILLKFLIETKLSNPLFKLKISFVNTNIIEVLDTWPDLPETFEEATINAPIPFSIKKGSDDYYIIWKLLAKLAETSNFVSIIENKEEQIEYLIADLLKRHNAAKENGVWKVSRYRRVVASVDDVQADFMTKTGSVPAFIQNLLEETPVPIYVRLIDYPFLTMTVKEFELVMKVFFKNLYKNKR